MRLLVIGHALSAAVHQRFLADLEARTGWSITIALPSRWKTSSGPEDMRQRWPSLKAEIRHVDVILPGSIRRHMYRSWMVGLLRELRPDAIYMHHEPHGFATAQVYLANRLAGRCPIGFYAARNLARRYVAPVRRMERWVLNHTDFAFASTEGALGLLREKGYRGAAEVLPTVIDPEIYYPEPEWGAARRSLMGFRPDRVLFGYMGRLAEGKGLGVLFSALEQLSTVPWELLLVGGGPLEMELRARVAASPGLRGRVHFVGPVPQGMARRWLSFFDVTVRVPETRRGWKEQFGRVLLESLACNTPVVGSACGEIPHLLRATGGGLLVQEGDAPALAGALRRLADDPALRAELAARGREVVARLYTEEALVEQFVGGLEAAVAARSRGSAV